MDKLYEEAKKAWEALAGMRAKRNRLKRFTYGRQWDDIVKDPDTGAMMTEHALISKQGRAPLTNNLLRQMLKSIIGKYRSGLKSASGIFPSEGSPQGKLGSRLRDFYLLNQLEELDSRLLEEFLISGIAVQRMGVDDYSVRKGFPAVCNISPEKLFFGETNDPRSTDLQLIGAVHGMTPEEIGVRWGGNDRSSVISKVAKLKEGFSRNGKGSERYSLETSWGKIPEGHIHVIEVWKKVWKEEIVVHDREKACVYHAEIGRLPALELENRKRRKAGEKALEWMWKVERCWEGHWYLAGGEALDSVTLCPGDEQPFLIKLYPLIDGEIHSLIEDVVDQQKYVNRLINLQDRMMATAAKGALLFPYDALPDGCEMEDIARQWSATDGVVVYRSLPNRPEPRQLASGVGDIGARELLQTEMQLFREISGVGDALSGKSRPSNIGAERYSMEMENASIAVKDILESFNSLITRRNMRFLETSVNNHEKKGEKK